MSSETWDAPALPAGEIPSEARSQPLGSHQDAVRGLAEDGGRGDGARSRAGLGDGAAGVPPLPRHVETGSRTYSGGKLRFGGPVSGELEPEDTVVYDLEVRRPTYIYFDIVYATRPATYTLFDAEGQEVFRQGSDLGPFRIERAGWYRLSIETDADIPVRYEIQFLQVGGSSPWQTRGCALHLGPRRSQRDPRLRPAARPSRDLQHHQIFGDHDLAVEHLRDEGRHVVLVADGILVGENDPAGAGFRGDPAGERGVEVGARIGIRER